MAYWDLQMRNTLSGSQLSFGIYWNPFQCLVLWDRFFQLAVGAWSHKFRSEIDNSILSKDIFSLADKITSNIDKYNINISLSNGVLEWIYSKHMIMVIANKLWDCTVCNTRWYVMFKTPFLFHPKIDWLIHLILNFIFNNCSYIVRYIEYPIDAATVRHPQSRVFLLEDFILTYYLCVQLLSSVTAFYMPLICFSTKMLYRQVDKAAVLKRPLIDVLPSEYICRCRYKLTSEE